jgi:GntR family transcriptional regulator, regulator for abcA and norABC
VKQGGRTLILEWKPDRSDVRPLYKQIVEYFEDRIRKGELPYGTLLPSERSLAKDLNINRSTVAYAYEELRATGLVVSKKGSGTRVSTLVRVGPKSDFNWQHYMAMGTLLPNNSIIRRIHEETQHKDLFDLATGELSPDLFPNEHFQQILKDGSFTNSLGYENPQGNFQLRETIAEHVIQYRHINSTPSSILITSGAQQALHLVVLCLLKPGDEVAIEDPSYCYSLPLFKSMGIKTHLLPVDDNGINPDDLLNLYRKHKIRMVFLTPNFHNPSGAVLSPERRKRILDMSVEYGIPIVEDDPYSLTAFQGKQTLTLKSMDSYGTVIYISSLSKIVSSGLRIGWIIAPEPIIGRLTDVKQQMDFGHSIFPQWIASEFLNSSFFPIHLKQLCLQLEERRDALISSLQEHLPNEIDFSVPQGGIHLWCEMIKPVNEEKLFETSINHGVIYVPGRALGSKKGFIRFTFGRANKTTIHKAIYRFSQSFFAVKEGF